MPVVFGAGDAVLSENEPNLNDGKKGFNLAFPIGWFVLFAELIVICLFSEDFFFVKTNVLVGKEFINFFIQFGEVLFLSISGGILAHSFCDDNRFNNDGHANNGHFAVYATPILVKTPCPPKIGSPFRGVTWPSCSDFSSSSNRSVRATPSS